MYLRYQKTNRSLATTDIWQKEAIAVYIAYNTKDTTKKKILLKVSQIKCDKKRKWEASLTVHQWIQSFESARSPKDNQSLWIF